MEVLSIVIYLIRCGTFCYEYTKATTSHERVRAATYAAYLALIAFPFAWLFSLLSNQNRAVVVVLSLIRIINPRPFLIIFRRMVKKYLNFQNWLRIFEVVFLYLILAHFIACMWIEVAKINDHSDHESWMRRTPVPQPHGTRTDESIDLSYSTIYVHAIYWSIVTFSHIGIGDVTAITVSERLYNCLVTLIYTFAYAVLFGNIASMVNDIATQVKSKLHKHHAFVIDLLNKKRLKHFRE
jgi:hypothetical protein